MDKSEKGKIGLFGAMAIGVGGMVGGGIFAVLGTAVSLAGGGTPMAFLFSGIIALITAYSYARLSVRFPSSGGTVVFVDKAFGVSYITGALNLLLWLSYLVTIALYASAFGSYAQTFFHSDAPSWLGHALISVAIVLPAAINLMNAALISKSETAIVVIKLLLLTVVIIAGWSNVDFSHFQPSHWESPLALVAGGMVIFVAYEGFELIANAAEDVRKPSQTLPSAFIGCVVFVVVLYVLVAVVTVGSVSPEVILQSKDYALAEAAKPSLGKVGFTVVAISALLATFSAINATIYGNARLGFYLAKDGELPEVLEKSAWNRPLGAVLLTTFLSLLLANLVDLESIAIMGSAGFLLVFAVVNAAAFKFGEKIGANRVITGIGALLCLISLVVLLVNTWRENSNAVYIFLSMLAFSLLFEWGYSKFFKRKIQTL